MLFALEEETESRRFSITRLIHYCADLIELFDTTRVVPVVIFLNAARDIPIELRMGSDRFSYLNFRYVQCVLSELDATEH